jgi:putative transposase
MRVADRRRDFLHKTTTRLTRTKSAIAVETLNVKRMVKNRRLSRAISDAGFGEFIRQLDYKADWYDSRSGKPTAGSPTRRPAGTAAGSTGRWSSLTGPGCVPVAVSCTTEIKTRQATSSTRCSPRSSNIGTLAGKFPGEAKRLVETT